MKLIERLWFPAVQVLLFTACGVYSFTGATLSPDMKTISVQTFFDEAGNGPPTLSINFTESVKEYFQRNTSLSLVPNEGDLQLEGSIVRYDLAPLAPTATGNINFPDEGVAAVQRLNITVKVVYVNLKDETKNFDQNFTFYADYDPQATDFNSVEAELVDEIFEQIILDIFNATIADW
jgi:hypothetical protein